MHIIFGDEIAKSAAENYIVLELDKFQIEPNGPVLTAYCVVEKDLVPIDDVPMVPNMIHLHTKLMENYRKQNWKFCEEAITHLFGQWGKELDSFYVEITSRVRSYKEQPPIDFNNGVIKKYTDNQ